MSTLNKQLAFAAALALSAEVVQAEVVDIDVAELAYLMSRGVPLIDIRTESEWKSSGIIAGSKTLTFFDKRGHVDPVQWLEKARAIAKPEQPLILICRSGNRTRAAARFLSEQAGYKQVFHVTRGIGGWVNEGYPLTPYTAK